MFPSLIVREVTQKHLNQVDFDFHENRTRSFWSSIFIVQALFESQFWANENLLDSSVGQAAARIATIFNSRLFNALLDIQDYYELHLHKNSVSNKISQFETFEVTVERYASGLGFSITGGIDSPVSPSGT